MYKFAGYIIKHPSNGQYLEVFFTQRTRAEDFCRQNHINFSQIKQVSIYDSN